MTVEHVDVVVVGSGFGGSAAALRLAEADRSVVVLERGKAYPPGSFPRSPRGLSTNFWDPSEGLHGMFNVWSFHGLEALVSAGLGGGSLIYANVLIRKDERWFVREDPRDGTYERWPIGRADLEEHYERAEGMLGVQQYPFEVSPYDATPKTAAMREAAARLGLEWQLPNLAVTFANPGEAARPGTPLAEEHPNLHGAPRQTCRLCGECDVGCNYGSKNTLDYTYLSVAQRRGADIRTRCEVRSFEPHTGGGYLVRYVEHLPSSEGLKTDTGSLPLREIHADRLVLSGGTLGSPYLLMRNRGSLPELSSALGTRFCGNGDLLAFVTGASRQSGRRREGRPLDPAYGPVITSAIRVPDVLDGGSTRGYYLEDGGYPEFVNWIREAADMPGTINRMVRFAFRRLVDRITRSPRSDLSAEMRALVGQAASANSLVMLGMGRDIPDGVMSLRSSYLDIDWTIESSKAYFDHMIGTMEGVADTVGGKLIPNPTWRLGRVITVHPLGGAPMAEHPGEGVVDSYGEVFGYPNLYVMDGSVMPGPVGPNPALTIAAFAERAASHIVEKGD